MPESRAHPPSSRWRCCETHCESRRKRALSACRLTLVMCMTRNKQSDVGWQRQDDPQWPYHGASQEICRVLGRVNEGYNPLQIFESFVDACHIVLDGLPQLLSCAAHHQPLADTPEIAQAWRQVTGKFKPHTIQLMSEALGVLLRATWLPKENQLSYADVIGSVYMQFLPAGKWRPHAQFFTPWNVASMMAQMTMLGVEEEFYRRLTDACESDPALKAMAWTCSVLGQAEELAQPTREWFLTRLWPEALRKIDKLRVIDPCVGSGVMLLGAASACPRWLIDCGFVEFYGVDIDPLCCKLARLNLRLYGLSAVALPADELTMEQAVALPWPHGKLYAGLLEAQQADDQGTVTLFRQGIELARAQQLELWAGLSLIMDEQPSGSSPSEGQSPVQKKTRRNGHEHSPQLVLALETTETV